jgi:hypothetical protein
LLAEVLQHVPQQQRLSQCALVNTSWAPAAAQATVHVAGMVKPAAVEGLQSWLSAHAGQVLSIKLRGSRHQALQLPLDKLTQLQHLQLNGFRLQLPGEERRPACSPAADSSDSSFFFCGVNRLQERNQATNVTPQKVRQESGAT